MFFPYRLNRIERSPRKILWKCKDCDRLFSSLKGCKIHVIKMHLKKNPSYRKRNNIMDHIDRVWF